MFGNMSDWARKKPELWMEKLLIWERFRGKGREGINDVVLVCSIAYIAVVQVATKDGGRRGHYEVIDFVKGFPNILFNCRMKIFR
jgi:hypothetical protein